MANTINATSGIGIVSTADNTNILTLQTNGTNGITIDASQNVSFANQLVLGVSGTTMQVRLSAAAETVTIAASAATGTVNFDVSTQSILYYTNNASGNWTLNIRGNSSTTLNSIMSTGQSVTITFLATQGSPAYYASALTVDGSSVTPKWSGGSAPTSGNTNGIDVYTYTLIKVGSGSFTALASQTRFA
jgi:dipeptidyl aminopeptidase/acylaminoacyl peptidase